MPGDPITILFVSANPSETARVRVQEEAKKVREQLGRKRPKGRPVRLNLEAIGAATPDDLRIGMEDYKPTILHFSGHSTREQGIVLEDEAGHTLPLSARLLERLCQHFSSCLKCVVLNACYTSHHAASVIQHVDFVIGMQTAIPDEVAISFSAAFYDGLAAGKYIPDAYDLACWSIEANYQSSLLNLYDQHQLRFTRDLIPELLPSHQIPILIERKANQAPNASTTKRVASQPFHPTPWLNVPTLLRLSRTASSATLIRALDRLPHSTEGEALTPTSRSTTAPDFKAFLLSDRKILAIIGGSGCGKSTLILQLASTDDNSSTLAETGQAYIPFFYDAQQIETLGSLTARLARDLQSTPEHLDATLETLGAVLQSSSSYLTVLIDAINECREPTPGALKAEIEDLAARTCSNIKFVYSCREVVWATYVAPGEQLPSRLYFGGQTYPLTTFSAEELATAFASYKEFYRFQGRLEDLKPVFRDKLRNPLMLRLIAETYSSRDLPSFAPAVLVFEAYERSLREKFRGTGVIDYLEDIVELKARQGKENEATGDVFTREEVMDLPSYSRAVVALQSSRRSTSDPLTALHDEGVIFQFGEKNGRMRFTYDRFFEYLLGKAIMPRERLEDRRGALSSLAGEVQRWSGRHFCFWQALKSEVIRRNLIGPRKPWDFSQGSFVRDLLEKGPIFREFAKDTLRELVFEGALDFEYLVRLQPSRSDSLALALDIAGDHTGVMPVLIDAFLSGNRDLRLRATGWLAKLGRDPTNRRTCERELLKRVEATSNIDSACATGLIYYTAGAFAVLEQTSADTGSECIGLWKKLLKSSGATISAMLRKTTEALVVAVKAEGELFFGEGFTPDGIQYPWASMSEAERGAALHLAKLLEKDEELSPEDIEVLSFFASAKARWSERKTERCGFHAYQVEYRIAEYLLVRRSQTDFHEVKRILTQLANTGDWFLVDFSLVVMRDILRYILYNDPERLREGFRLMIEWDRDFEAQSTEYYRAIKAKDPFSVNSVPLYLVAVVEAEFLTRGNNPISVLQKEIESDEPNRILMALLAARLLGRKGRCNLGSILASLRMVINHESSTVREWVDRVLRELHLLHPRLLDRFLLDQRLPRPRAAAIRHHYASGDIEGVAHNGEPLYRFLFLGSESRLRLVRTWHKKMLEAPALETFLGELVDELFRQALLADEIGN